MMVSAWALPNEITLVIGSTLAGMYKMKAAITSAQVRAMLLGLRECRRAPQRGQTAARPLAADTALQSRWQLWQLISEARIAVSDDGFMGLNPIFSTRYVGQELKLKLRV